MTAPKVVPATQVLLLREKETAHLSPVRVIALPSQQTPRQVAISGARGAVLSEDGVAYTLDTEAGGGLELIRIPQAVRMVACNETAMLVVTEQGLVLSQGTDPDNCGFLGGPRSFDRPTAIEGFGDARVTQVGLGKTHAAALDSKG